MRRPFGSQKEGMIPGKFGEDGSLQRTFYVILLYLPLHVDLYVHVHINGAAACLNFIWLLICIQNIIVSTAIVIERGRGVWGSPTPQIKKNVSNFRTNSAISGNTKGYMCSDIMSQQESKLPILKHIYIVFE